MHLPAGSIQWLSVKTSLDTVIDPFVNGFDGAAPVPELWISRKYRAVIITPGAGTRIQMALLTIHTIADSGDLPFGTQIKGRVGDELATISDERAFGRMWYGAGIRCNPWLILR